MTASATPLVRGSPLKRNEWAAAAMLEGALQSYIAPFEGDGPTSVVHKKMMNRSVRSSSSNGHRVVFPAIGGLNRAPIVGKGQLAGTGEGQRAYSSEIVCEWIQSSVALADKFDAIDSALPFDDMNFAKSQLANWWVNFYDQYAFDALQGTAVRPSQAGESGGLQLPTHQMNFPFSGNDPEFGYDQMMDIMTAAAAGDGFTSLGGTGSFGGTRQSLAKPAVYKGKAKMRKGMSAQERMMAQAVDGGGMYNSLFLFVDPHVYNILIQDDRMVNILQNADYRGNMNMLFKGMQGTSLDGITLIKTPLAKGTVANTSNAGRGSGTLSTSGFSRGQVQVDECGLRQRDSSFMWSGQTQSGSERWSRCVLVGRNALQSAMSTAPWMSTDDSDHNKNIEVGLHNFMGIQKTRLRVENAGDKAGAPVANIDFGVITVDVQTSA